jgi:hypothetical protein
VVEAMDIISTQDARGWFKHCDYQVTPDSFGRQDVV